MGEGVQAAIHFSQCHSMSKNTKSIPSMSDCSGMAVSFSLFSTLISNYAVASASRMGSTATTRCGGPPEPETVALAPLRRPHEGKTFVMLMKTSAV